MTYATTSISSPLSIVYACIPVLASPIYPVSAVYFSTSVASMLLLSLSPFSIGVPTTATYLVLSSESVSLVAHLIVKGEADVV